MGGSSNFATTPELESHSALLPVVDVQGIWNKLSAVYAIIVYHRRTNNEIFLGAE